MRTLAALLLLAAAPASAQISDDSDLGSPAPAARPEREARAEPGSLVFPLAAKARFQARADGRISGRLVLVDRKGASRPGAKALARLVGPESSEWTGIGEDGAFSFSPRSQPGAYKVRVSLDNGHWAFRDRKGDAAYEWEGPAFTLPAGQGLDLGEFSPAPGSESAKLAVLHLTYVDAFEFLRKEGSVDWWKKRLKVHWPGSADYFDPARFGLHITNALAWDVNLHELGHAVMSGAMRAAMGGGQHKIDECYSEVLAWSEGWATFFAGAVALSPDDEDARFEFLVPRRAPIRVENVPADVCAGPTNEWRVSAGLWDLYDRHADGGDELALGFAPLWKAFTGGPTKSLGTAWDLVAKELNPLLRQAGEKALAHNTLRKAAEPLAFRPIAAPVDWAAPR